MISLNYTTKTLQKFLKKIINHMAFFFHAINVKVMTLSFLNISTSNPRKGLLITRKWLLMLFSRPSRKSFNGYSPYFLMKVDCLFAKEVHLK